MTDYNLMVATICIAFLGAVYLLMGHNSVGFTTLIGALCGIAGYVIPSPFQKKIEKKSITDENL